MNFQKFNLDERLISALEKCKFKDPTEIQEKALPALINQSTDFVGQAQTGTGKTAAYLLPLLQNLKPDSKGLQALVLTPTRELAKQVDPKIK